ncbi:aldehyde dehydrogenase family protein [Seongchinamella sediminis]|uniref:Aldehyde dehydrogenase family protein n=1 Tax=Seongchinamella sediminis TaxID=2283635 RepID=A0A3L7DWR9_9GAMM|nr:NAD-dependent succinate-semialdehyde dehydrogenase [Seongchinamella sediminis]RLQ21754.1 aldehyde dehydrogenase family protein [Seongchinamella sediminis]
MLFAIDPATGQSLGEYPSLDQAALNQHIQRAQDAYPGWRKTPLQERARVLQAVAACLRREKSALAELMAREMGKPVKEGGPEVEKAAWCAEHYAEFAERYLQREELPSDAALSYVCYQPLGTTLSILPWNAPLWLAFRALAPALMAGNTCVLKHDPNVPGCGAAIEGIFREAGAPTDIVVNIPIETAMVESAIRHPAVAAVSFTGSDRAGAIVASIAGSEIKPVVLELGGSDPFVVLADADLEKAADVATLSRIINAGQSCIAAKRIIVEAPVYDRFIDLLKPRLRALTLGNPLSTETDIGPLARGDLRDNLHRQVQETVAAGANCALGGELPQGPGFFYPATLLTEVTDSMCAFREETFGPVMAVTRAGDAEHALELANATDYGLGAGVWTGNQEMAEQFAMEINAGQVAINGIVKTDPRLPSGGIKRSGLGRELGPHGIREFVNAKQVWIG